MPTHDHLAWGRQFAHLREAARRAAWERQARRASGVCWSGIAPAPFTPATAQALEQEARYWAGLRQGEGRDQPLPPAAD